MSDIEALQPRSDTIEPAKPPAARMPVGVDGRNEQRVSLGDKRGQLRRDHVVPPTALLYRGVAFPRAEPLLNGLDRRGEGNFADWAFYLLFSTIPKSGSPKPFRMRVRRPRRAGPILILILVPADLASRSCSGIV